MVTPTEIRLKGRTLTVPGVDIGARRVVVTGSWLKTAEVKDEELLPDATVDDPADFVRILAGSGLRADIFTFFQRVPDFAPRFPYAMSWENAAVVPITTYQDWLTNHAESDVRKAIKKSARLGVTVRTAEFDDTLVQGIVEIYNDSPVRQGKPFWHYRKPFEQVKLENGTFLDRSEFIGAYDGSQLLGFIKLVYLRDVAATIQVISRVSAYDRKVVTALLAFAVDLCERRRKSHLVYGSFSYNGQVSSLSEFKRRHGFREMQLPRYHVPLTLKGRFALWAGLQRGWLPLMPARVVRTAMEVRRRLHAARQRLDSAPEGTSSFNHQ